MVCMYVCEVWMRLEVNTSVYALYGEANARSWKSSDRQTSKCSENFSQSHLHEQSIFQDIGLSLQLPTRLQSHKE